MTISQDNLEKVQPLVDSALTSVADANFAARPATAIGLALKLGAAVALVLLEIAGDVGEIRRLCEDGARCDGCDCG